MRRNKPHKRLAAALKPQVKNDNTTILRGLYVSVAVTSVATAAYYSFFRQNGDKKKAGIEHSTVILEEKPPLLLDSDDKSNTTVDTTERIIMDPPASRPRENTPPPPSRPRETTPPPSSVATRPFVPYVDRPPASSNFSHIAGDFKFIGNPDDRQKDTGDSYDPDGFLGRPIGEAPRSRDRAAGLNMKRKEIKKQPETKTWRRVVAGAVGGAAATLLTGAFSAIAATVPLDTLPMIV